MLCSKKSSYIYKPVIYICVCNYIKYSYIDIKVWGEPKYSMKLLVFYTQTHESGHVIVMIWVMTHAKNEDHPNINLNKEE